MMIHGESTMLLCVVSKLRYSLTATKQRCYPIRMYNEWRWYLHQCENYCQHRRHCIYKTHTLLIQFIFGLERYLRILVANLFKDRLTLLRMMKYCNTKEYFLLLLCVSKPLQYRGIWICVVLLMGVWKKLIGGGLIWIFSCTVMCAWTLTSTENDIIRDLLYRSSYRF